MRTHRGRAANTFWETFRMLEMVASSRAILSRVGRSSLFAFRLPLPRQLLRLGDLGRGHLFGESITKFGRWLISVRCRQAVPLMSLDKIMRHTLAIIVHDANFRLSESLSLICSHTEPSQGLLVVFWDSTSV